MKINPALSREELSDKISHPREKGLREEQWDLQGIPSTAEEGEERKKKAQWWMDKESNACGLGQSWGKRTLLQSAFWSQGLLCPFLVWVSGSCQARKPANAGRLTLVQPFVKRPLRTYTLILLPFKKIFSSEENPIYVLLSHMKHFQIVTFLGPWINKNRTLEIRYWFSFGILVIFYKSDKSTLWPITTKYQRYCGFSYDNCCHSEREMVQNIQQTRHNCHVVQYIFTKYQIHIKSNSQLSLSLVQKEDLCCEKNNFISILFFWTIISWKINGIVDTLNILGPISI